MDRLTWVLNHLVSHDVALRNAAVASIRMGHRRREREDADHFVARLTQSRDEQVTRIDRRVPRRQH